MFQSGRSGFFLFWFVLMFISFLSGQEQMVFFSQSEQLISEQERFFTRKLSPARSMLLLNGTYDLLDGESRIRLGQITMPSVFHHSHSLIFQKIFPKQENPDSRYFLYLERLVGSVRISINDQLLYEGSRNFQPLLIPVPSDLVTRQSNTLAIYVTPWRGLKNQLPAWIPINLPRVDHGSSGAIYLSILPETAITGLDYRTYSRNESGIIEGEFMISSSTTHLSNMQITVQIFQKNQLLGTFPIETNLDSSLSQQQIPFKIILHPRSVWSPENPGYYRMMINISKDDRIIDQYSSRVAFRDIEIRNNRLYLNNEPFSWKGINYVYQDSRGVSLFDRRLVIADLQRLKSRGFNLIRIPYFPQSDRFYDLTDSLGILCMQDLPLPLLADYLFTDSTKTTNLFNYVKHFKKLIGPHPSVIAVGLNNFYLDNTLVGSAMLDSLARLAESDGEWLSYISHFDQVALQKSSAQFGILEILERPLPWEKFEQDFNSEGMPYPLILSALSLPLSLPFDTSQVSANLLPLQKMYMKLLEYPAKEKFVGQLFYTYSDYILETPSLQSGTIADNEYQTYPQGLWNKNRKIKPLAESILKGNWIPQEGDPRSTIQKEIHTYLFLIIGVVNLFIFLFLYRSFMEFRKNIFRSLRKPHGFFVELLERRIISYEQSFYLILVISVNAAVMLGGIIYFFRNNLLMDYLISLILPQAIAKQYAIHIIWKPYLLIPAIVGLIIITFLFLTIIIQLFSFFRRPRIRLRQAVATSTWAASPFLLLLPFGMFFYNLLLVMKSYWILGIALLYFHVWYVIRWLNGARVMTISSYLRVIVFSLFLGIFLGAGIYFLFYHDLTLTVHLKMLIQILTEHI